MEFASELQCLKSGIDLLLASGANQQCPCSLRESSERGPEQEIILDLSPLAVRPRMGDVRRFLLVWSLLDIRCLCMSGGQRRYTE